MQLETERDIDTELFKKELWWTLTDFLKTFLHSILLILEESTHMPVIMGHPGGSDGKASVCMQETQVQFLVWDDPLEKEMAAHSSILAWKIPWTAEPGRLLSMGSQKVEHN